MAPPAHRPPVPIRIGPAGWAYKDWEGIVFPRPKPRGFDPLEYLSRFFDTVEINTTFYRPASAEVAERWADRVAHHPTFRFCVKLWQRFTHQRDAPPSKDEVRQAREALDALSARGRLGAVLLQFPWSFRHTGENRAWLDGALSAFADYPRVVEVRHASWVRPEYFVELAERGVGFVNVDQPLFHDSIKPSARGTGPVAYIRVHGRNYREWFRKDAGRDARYDYLYTAKELRPWADRAAELAGQLTTGEVYVVTNNHSRGKAPANALMLQAMLAGHKAQSPPELYAAYRDALGPFAEPAGESRPEIQPTTS
jgi:uncharacterized protein YecE (DUF72 family)